MISRHDEIENEIKLLALRVRQSDGVEKQVYSFCLKRQYIALKNENNRLGGDFEPDYEMMDEAMKAKEAVNRAHSKLTGKLEFWT